MIIAALYLDLDPKAFHRGIIDTQINVFLNSCLYFKTVGGGSTHQVAGEAVAGGTCWTAWKDQKITQ